MNERTRDRGLFQRLHRPCDALRRNAVASRIQSSLIIDDAILEEQFGESFSGAEPDTLRVDLTSGAIRLPQQAMAWQKANAVPASNRAKVFLTKRSPLVLPSDRANDQDCVRMTLGRSYYFDSLAMHESAAQIHRDIEAGDIDDLFQMDRQLNCHLLLLTSTNQLVLARRMGAQVTRVRPDQWGATVGESMDADKDVVGGLYDPTATVRRALTRREEIGLTEEMINEANICFLGLITECDQLLAVLIALVRLPVDMRAVEDGVARARDGAGKEIRALDAIPFTPTACMPIIASGLHSPSKAPYLANMVYGTSRLAVLAALMRDFSDAELHEALDEFDAS